VTAADWARWLAVELTVVTRWGLDDDTRAAAQQTLSEYRAWVDEQGSLRLMADLLGDGPVSDHLRSGS
jgi:hypothetical protein